MFVFLLCNDVSDGFWNILANTPDVVMVDNISGEVHILEAGCTSDHGIEEAVITKLLKKSAASADYFPAGLQMSTFHFYNW